MTIVGPITDGERKHPHGASIRDLASIGYIEEEFYLEGIATLYSTPIRGYEFDGRWAVSPRGGEWFRTRVLVNRPVDPEQFTGIVIVNWNNVSSGADRGYGRTPLLYESGWAWVGVTAQKIGVEGHQLLGTNGLRGWDASRYGSLSIAGDDASFDIFTQAINSIGPRRPSGEVDPMGGLPVTHVIATGASQSANRLATYYNAVQPLTDAIDGLQLIVYSGGGCRLDATMPGPSLTGIPDEYNALVNILPHGHHQLRDDLAVPVMILNSETEAPWYRPARQPDSQTIRLWEVAGTSHAGHTAPRDDIVAEMLRDEGVDICDPASTVALTAQEHPNPLEFAAVREASTRHLVRWVRDGLSPPAQDRILFTKERPSVMRDKEGNAVGGIRLPEMEAPTAAYVGVSPPDAADLTGSCAPFSADTLRSLYPTRESFIERYRAAVDAGVTRGYFLSDDADYLTSTSLPRALSCLPEDLT